MKIIFVAEDGKQFETEKELEYYQRSIDFLKWRANKFKNFCELISENKHFWLSIKHKDNCLFGRRNGFSGKLLFGYSIRLRLFDFDVI